MGNIAKIKEYCIANGEGLRTAVFFSGCPHACYNCFNKELWDYNYGELYTKETEKRILSTVNEHIAGLSLLGGEPLCDANYENALNLCIEFKKLYPKKNIWTWTGYTLDQLKTLGKTEILNYIDVLIDGKYVDSKKDYDLKWRGSSNQRILEKNKDF